jgi:hypothetical protein
MNKFQNYYFCGFQPRKKKKILEEFAYEPEKPRKGDRGGVVVVALVIKDKYYK